MSTLYKFTDHFWILEIRKKNTDRKFIVKIQDFSVCQFENYLFTNPRKLDQLNIVMNCRLQSHIESEQRATQTMVHVGSSGSYKESLKIRLF